MNRNINDFAYEALRAFALTHNYNKWIYNIFKPYIGRRVLEIGCGIGNMSQYFMQSCEKLVGIDTSSCFLEHLKIDYPQLELHNCDINSDKVLSLKNNKFDTIISINVLEHIEDDNKALKNMYDLLEPGGHLLLFVPALSFLFGTIDRQVNHYRRYDKNPLKNQLKATGFEITNMFYSNILGIFGWLVNGKILRRKKFPILQPIMFDKIVPLLSTIEKYVKLPLGMTLIAVAKKPGK